MFWNKHVVPGVNDLLSNYSNVYFAGLVDTTGGGQINGATDIAYLSNFVQGLTDIRTAITSRLTFSGPEDSWPYVKPEWHSPSVSPFTNTDGGATTRNQRLITELAAWDAISGEKNILTAPIITGSGHWSLSTGSPSGVHWRAGTTMDFGYDAGFELMTAAAPQLITGITSPY